MLTIAGGIVLAWAVIFVLRVALGASAKPTAEEYLMMAARARRARLGSEYHAPEPTRAVKTPVDK